MSESDSDFFVMEWTHYRKKAVLDDEEARDALMETITKELWQMTYTTSAVMQAPMEQAFLEGVKSLAVDTVHPWVHEVSLFEIR